MPPRRDRVVTIEAAAGEGLTLARLGGESGGMMFTTGVPVWEIAARTAVVYLALLLGLRLAGKREIGQMTPFDLVVILLVANAVQNAMVGPDTSLTGGLIAAAILILANYGLAAVREHVPWFQRAVEGVPTLLIHDGEFIADHLRQEHVDEQEVMMALREHGIDDPHEVRVAVLETDGSISVVPVTYEQPLQTRHRVRTRHHQ